MAFPGTVGDRKMEDLGYRNLGSHEMSNFPSYAPLRLGENGSATLSSPNDSRATIQRRFTTDSMKVSFNPRASYDAGGLQRLPISESLDLAPSVGIPPHPLTD